MKKWIAKTLCTIIAVLVLGTAIFPTFVSAETDLSGGYQESQSYIPACSFAGGFFGKSEGTFEGCIARGLYYGVLYPTVWLTAASGQIFDFFVSYSLNSNSYRDGFVEKGWRILRDIANALFIFILLYIAISFVLGIANQNIQRIIARVIIAALVLNFSLFTTRLIIDAGNILARVFYENILVTNDDLGAVNEYKTLSAGIASYVNPQALLSEGIYNKRHDIYAQQGTTINESLGTSNDSGGAVNPNDLAANAGFMILIISIAIIVNVLLIYVFLSTCIFFVGRTLGLWFMMILSPLAFASISIPFVQLPKYGWKDWLNKTLSLSFMAVVFMFFLFLTIMFLDTAFGSIQEAVSANSEASTIHRIMAVLVPTAVVVGLLIAAQKQAKSMSGEFGGYVGKALKYGVLGAVGAAGLSVGAAGVVGGVALRQTVGRLGAQMAKGGKKTPWGRAIKRTGKYLSESSFDVRNINIPKPVGKVAGYGRQGLSLVTDGAVSAGDFTTNIQGGGSNKNYARLKEDRIKRKVDQAKIYAANENSSLNNVDHEYQIEETTVDASGNVRRVKRTVQDTQDKISVAEAKKRKREAEIALEEKKAQVHRDENYLDKKQELEKRERAQEDNEKAYKDLLERKKSGDPTVSQFMLDTARDYVNTAKQDVKNQKNIIKQVEMLYEGEANEVSRFASMVEASKRSLNKKNAEIYNNYANSLESWSWAPAPPLNHRGPADRGAASRVRNMANQEERINLNKND